MKLLICIDDTDNLESRGTGSIAAEMTKLIEGRGWGKCGFISRHQLILHKDVKYTSHNSSMCFNADIDGRFIKDLQTDLSSYLAAEMAEGSDPGICIADIENLCCWEQLIEFGYRAKTEVLTMKQAYDLAGRAGIYLKELGGTGDGIIGALAGVGLRLHGNDGEVKGGIEHLGMGMSFSVETLLKEALITEVLTTDMKPLVASETVSISWKAKPLMYDGQPVLLAVPNPAGEGWVTLHKIEMREFGDKRAGKKACGLFKPDVPEELVDEDAKSCYNCVYRRWTEDSIECKKS